jgi:hypothetical protein
MNYIKAKVPMNNVKPVNEDLIKPIYLCNNVTLNLVRHCFIFGQIILIRSCCMYD